MVDGFFWTRLTAKQLRFLYEDIVLAPLPAPMNERAARVDAPAIETPAIEPAAPESDPPASKGEL